MLQLNKLFCNNIYWISNFKSKLNKYTKMFIIFLYKQQFII
ncbi:unnamed protein product [Meloidogyne enterolobii]|uniref:Uncharacterized protein n=1 Tax=Meloidogyne enterolobii TaxID=390850 RepID=A0ACB0YJB8_MELEN